MLLSCFLSLFLQYLHDFGCPLGPTFNNMFLYIMASWQSVFLQIYLSLYIENAELELRENEIKLHVNFRSEIKILLNLLALEIGI